MHRETPDSFTTKRLRGEERIKGEGNRHPQAERGMEGMWSRLPDELLERALPYLPVSDLCRFCSVCKRWNSLISVPEFGTLCVQINASKGASTGACLVVKIRAFIPHTKHYTEIQSWSIFDLNARRWYNVKHELPKGYDYNCQTMDGGLVCTFVDAFTDAQRRTSTISNVMTTQPQTFIISNLLGGTIKVLPNPPPLFRYSHLAYMNLKLVVDSKSHTYKVFLILVGYFYRPGDPCMCVYESSTNQWRTAPTPPNPQDLYAKFGPDVRSAWFQGLLYVLLVRSSNLLGQLYSYNFLEDTWEDTGVQFCNGKITYMLDKCDLVVSDNRLFLMTQHLMDHSMSKERRRQLAWLVDISEISLPDKALKTVVQLSPAEVYKKFNIAYMHRGCQLYKIRAFGYGRSILLTCEETGKAIEYNLVTGLWETLPPNPVESLQLRSIPHFSQRHTLRYGKLMSGCLRLPDTPWS